MLGDDAVFGLPKGLNKKAVWKLCVDRRENSASFLGLSFRMVVGAIVMWIWRISAVDLRRYTMYSNRCIGVLVVVPVKY